MYKVIETHGKEKNIEKMRDIKDKKNKRGRWDERTHRPKSRIHSTERSTYRAHLPTVLVLLTSQEAVHLPWVLSNHWLTPRSVSPIARATADTGGA
jgi:hypothetical protein